MFMSYKRFLSKISLIKFQNREEMQVGGIDIRGSTQKKYAVEVRVRDEHSLMKAVLNSLKGIDIMYIVEIKPPLSRNSVHVMPVEPLECEPTG